MVKRTRLARVVPRLLLLLVGFGIFLHLGSSQITHSLNLTSVSDTLSTSRFSWVTRQGSGNAVSSALVNIDGTPNGYESTSSANLFINDTILTGQGTTMSTYTVKGIVSATQIEVSPVLAAGQATAGQFMIASRSATHTVAFTSATAVANGAFRVLVPAVSTAANAKDGIPDAGGFDYGAGPSVTCPADVGSTYDFVAGVASSSAVTIGSTAYHAFTCAYSGAGAITQAFTGFVIGTTNPLINPAPKTNHVDGTADSYNIIVQQMDSTKNTVIDQTVGAIAVVESVRVTATVDPQITFRVGGVNSGASVCGISTAVTTTSTLVPFGSIFISTFTDAAQYLSVSTNATGGYTVTAAESDQLGRNGNVCTGPGPTFSNPCIPDAVGNAGLTMSETTTNAWSDTNKKGFAFTLADPNSSTTPDFTSATGYRQFADQETTGPTEAPQEIFHGAGVADNANVYVCYRIIVSAIQQAGDYSNSIIYRATATF